MSIVIIITKFPVRTNKEFHTLDNIHIFISHFKAIDSQSKEMGWIDLEFISICVYLKLFHSRNVVLTFICTSIRSL